MAPEHHRRVALARHPQGAPTLDDFRLETVAAPQPAPGHMLVRNRIASFDPGIRGWLNDQAAYMAPVPLGATVRGMTLGEVVASDVPAYRAGTLVRAMAGWEEYSLLAPDALGLERVEPAPGVALDHYMGALGPAGLTAWVGMCAIGEAGPGDTVLVSAAAGAVGSVAGQIARLKGARVIGVAGGHAKVATLADLRFDTAIDHRAGDLGDAIARAAPEGVSIYFDNVGGAVLETALLHMREGGRVVACGMIADYNDFANAYGVRTLFQVVARRLIMRGFFTYDRPELLPQANAELAAWVAKGELVGLLDARDGIEACPQAFVDLMAGRTLGKTLVRLV